MVIFLKTYIKYKIEVVFFSNRHIYEKSLT